jgi:uncharacterized protein (DUF1330 family)
MLGYAIFNIQVTNPEDYKEYLQHVTAIAEKFGGKYIVRGGQSGRLGHSQTWKYKKEKKYEYYG